jgi:hypothetical protein
MLSLFWDNMSSSFPISSASGIILTFAIAVILLASNFTIIDAQQQLGQPTSQPEEAGNGTTVSPATIFQSANDSFSIQVPDGWIVDDINNSTSAMSEETRLGYGVIAQLCSQEEQQLGREAFSTSANASISNNNSCQGAQEEVIHIVRYPDLDTRLLANNITATNNNMTITDNIVSYQLQKFQEAGYRSMQIITSTDMTVNLINPRTNERIETLPAKLVEMTYGTNISPNEIRRGYLVSTATNSTAPNLGSTKGYAVFYEGNSTITNAIAAAIAGISNSLPPPTLISQLFDSFELIVAPELLPASVQQVAQPVEFAAVDPTDDEEEADDDDDDDNGRDDDDDDNGRDDDDDDDDNGRDDDDDDDDNGRDDDDDDNGRDEDIDCENRGGRSCEDDYDGTPDAEGGE